MYIFSFVRSFIPSLWLVFYNNYYFYFVSVCDCDDRINPANNKCLYLKRKNEKKKHTKQNLVSSDLNEKCTKKNTKMFELQWRFYLNKQQFQWNANVFFYWNQINEFKINTYNLRFIDFIEFDFIVFIERAKIKNQEFSARNDDLSLCDFFSK